MAELDRMFRSELAVLSDSQNESDSWVLDTPSSISSRHAQLPSVFDSPSFDSMGYVHPHTEWDALPPNFADAVFREDHLAHLRPHVSEHLPPQGDALHLFPSPNNHLGCPTTDTLNAPFTAHHPPTVHLSDVTFGPSLSPPTTHRIHHPVPSRPPVPISITIPVSAVSSAPPSSSPPSSYKETSEEDIDIDSSDLEFTYPSDSDYNPTSSSLAVDPASLSIPPPHSLPSRRKPRSMTKVPVPIPNLTKKSRGRKVPTSANGEPIYALSRDKTKKGVRTYTCHADGCGKCFVRGEHLKRHIRSIHTDEKPWVCTYDDCKRAFSRRDNLNQHLRVHKLQDGEVECQ